VICVYAVTFVASGETAGGVMVVSRSPALLLLRGVAAPWPLLGLADSPLAGCLAVPALCLERLHWTVLGRGMSAWQASGYTGVSLGIVLSHLTPPWRALYLSLSEFLMAGFIVVTPASY